MARTGDFQRLISYLSEQVGTGNVTAGCTVNQPYAQNQHQNLTFRHTVGRAHYLGAPLMENALTLLEGIARSVITKEGSDLEGEMRDVAEKMADYVLKNAPRDPDVGDVLANSGSPWVKNNGMETYRRPPVAPRRRDR